MTRFLEEERQHVMKAVVHRCYVDYVGFYIFDGRKTPDLPYELSDLDRFLSTIRSMEAEKHGVANPDRIAVVMLVDEVNEVGLDNVGDLLVGLAGMEQTELMEGSSFRL